jgi:hypothetical protein
VLLKPSELTPATSALLHEGITANFNADEFAVLQGGVDAGRAFTQLPFDHLFFTGSTAVGREVALAAAANLTPDAGTGRQVTGAFRRGRRSGGHRTASHGRQAAQCRTDVHCARLRIGAAGFR